jgi:hypothetical protein
VEEPTETVLHVYVIGDSHALPYRNLMFRDKWTGQWVSVRSKYVSGLAANGLFNSETEEFHPDLIRFLEHEGLVRDGRATHLSTDQIDFAIAQAAGQSVRPPLLLIIVGDIDIRAAIMPILKDTHDFVPPFEMTLGVLDRPLVPWDILDEAIERHIAPTIAGLRQLINCGFNRLYVQAVVPPTTNEARVRELHGYDCPVSVRTRLVACFNRKLSAECEAIGVTVLDNWPALTELGMLRPELEVDGVHLPPRAAWWFVEALLEHAVNRQWFAVNHIRYELHYRMACGLDPFSSADHLTSDIR